jgi:hypothetical protein
LISLAAAAAAVAVAVANHNSGMAMNIDRGIPWSLVILRQLLCPSSQSTSHQQQRLNTFCCFHAEDPSAKAEIRCGVAILNDTESLQFARTTDAPSATACQQQPQQLPTNAKSERARR